MVLGSKKFGHLINKERDGNQNEKLERRHQRKRLVPRLKRKKAPVNVQDVNIGDRIRLRDLPWKGCEGAYPCKVIRRPDFAESNLVNVAGGACARAVAQSTKQHVMIVNRHVVEFTLLNDTIGRNNLCKMRVRKKEALIALFFREGKDDPFILNCNECSEMSQQIRAARGRGLVKKEAVNKALHLIQEIQAQERALEYQPSMQRVNEIMSLYERAAEQFELAGEHSRQEEVEEHKMKFLAQPYVESIKNGYHLEQPKAGPRKEPEILETSLRDVGDDVIHGDNGSQNWAEFEVERDGESLWNDDVTNESVGDMISEARHDFDAFNLRNESDSEMDRDEAGTPVVKDEPDFATQFEAMMKVADQELEEIRNM